MNPRIQVEHTVTEEITDVDLVQSQMRIAAGESLADLGSVPGHVSGSTAPPCSAGSPPRTRPTASGPTPARSPPTARRAAPASGWTAAPSTPGWRSAPHFDSMLVKLTCRGRTFEAAVARARRALAEFRIRGVSTNIPFLQAVLEDPDFLAGDVSTAFIERAPGAAHHPCARRPRHQAAALAGRGHGQQAVRASRRPARPAGRSCPRRRRPGACRRRSGLPAAAAGARPGGVRRRPAAADRPSRSPTPPSATPTSRCWPPGSGPRTCCGSPRTSAG